MDYSQLSEQALGEAADGNDPAALYETGRRLFTAGDKTGGKKYLRLSMQLGNTDACYELGQICAEDGETECAIEAFREGRRGGDERCAFAYAVLQLLSCGDPESMELVASMANDGDDSAVRVLEEYYTRLGNKREAAYWHSKRAGDDASADTTDK